MIYTVLSLFPGIIDGFFSASIMARAMSRGIVAYRSVNIRDYALDKHRTCDDAPYGGGAGMLMRCEPLDRALAAAGARRRIGLEGEGDEAGAKPRVLYPSPSGRPFTQEMAREFAQERELIILCGRYEGIDQRIIDLYVDDEISVGDYVLSSGETAALVIIDATYRLIDQVIRAESLEEESFADYLLEYPQFTRPEIYANLRVPEILLSGHHDQIRRWRRKKQVEKTLALRPDLIRLGEAMGLYDEETRQLIEELGENRDDERN